MLSRNRTALLLSSPWILTFLAFWIIPLVYSLVVSFTDYELLKPGYSWIGLDNYRELFADPAFRSALRNTFIFVIGTIPVTTVAALGLALLVNRRFRFREFFRAGFFLPAITSMVVVALIFTNLYERGGYIAMLAQLAGFSPPESGFLFDKRTALFAIMAMDVWMSVGYYMLIFLAGLQSIPKELYEAAEICGASHFRKFISITLPMLQPVALFVIVINSIKSFQVFVEIFVMTKGAFDTSTAVYFIYDTALRSGFRLGYASAAAYILFLIIAIFSILQFSLIKRKDIA